MAAFHTMGNYEAVEINGETSGEGRGWAQHIAMQLGNWRGMVFDELMPGIIRFHFSLVLWSLNEGRCIFCEGIVGRPHK